MGKIRESHIERRLVDAAVAAGALVRKLSWVNRVGAPDRLIIYRGKVYFVELKSPEGALEPAQTNEHRKLRNAGADVCTLNSYVKVDAFIDRMKSEAEE